MSSNTFVYSLMGSRKITNIGDRIILPIGILILIMERMSTIMEALQTIL